MKISKTNQRAARDYCAAIDDACRRLKIDPIKAIVDTDDYPALAKQWQVEFSLGWLRGVADATGLSVRYLWDAYAPRAKAAPAPNRRKAA